MQTLNWPAATAPRLKLAGQFPLSDRAFEVSYHGPAHALHLHAYAGRMILADVEIDLRPGDLTLSPAGRRSAYDLEAPGAHWCVHFEPAASEPVADAVALPLHLRLGGAASHAAERLAGVARLQARAGDDPLARARAAIAFQDLLLWSAAQAKQAGVDELERLADTVAAIVEARFTEPMNVARLAREVGRPQHMVARAFRRRFEMTVPRYLLLRRLAHARFLLESTDLPIAAVGRRVGIPDPQYFNKLARRFLGESPRKVRARTPAARPEPACDAAGTSPAR